MEDERARWRASFTMRAALLLSLVVSTSAQPCNCGAINEPVASTCMESGDPHFKTLSGSKYDFMARGTYRFLHASTPCG